MWNKLKILLDSTFGLLIRAAYDLRLIKASGQGRLNNEQETVIVSLTSYGRRVGRVLPYSLYSLLRQTVRPDKIVLWLDNVNWKDGNLPERVRELKEKGLIEVRYCRDIRSYKKLVPSLDEFPDAIIITADDDLYYRRDMVERLLEEHHRSPGCIITHRAHRPLIRNGCLGKYNDWEMCVSGLKEGPVFPTGGAGCLYRRELLYEDVTRDDLFMSLCPSADDVWFYFMEVLKGTRQIVLKHRREIYIPLDNFYQLTHKGSNLSDSNCHESGNDAQIRAVMEHYGIDVRNGRF